METLNKLKPSSDSTVDIDNLRKKCYEALDDDLNSPILLSHLFEGVRIINSVADGSEKADSRDLEALKSFVQHICF